MSTKAQALTLPAPRSSLSRTWVALLLAATILAGLFAAFLATRGSASGTNRTPGPVPAHSAKGPSDANFWTPTCPQCR